MLRIFIIAGIVICLPAVVAQKYVPTQDMTHSCGLDKYTPYEYTNAVANDNVEPLTYLAEHCGCNNNEQYEGFVTYLQPSSIGPPVKYGACLEKMNQTDCPDSWSPLPAAISNSGSFYALTTKCCENTNGTVPLANACTCPDTPEECSSGQYCYYGVCAGGPTCTDNNDCGGDKPHCVSSFCFSVGNECANTNGTAVQDACVCGSNECSDNQFCYNGECYQSDPTVNVDVLVCGNINHQDNPFGDFSDAYQSLKQTIQKSICGSCGSHDGYCSINYIGEVCYGLGSCLGHLNFYFTWTCPNGTVSNNRELRDFTHDIDISSSLNNYGLIESHKYHEIYNLLRAEASCHLCIADTYAPDRNGLDKCLRPDPGYIGNSDQSGQVPDPTSCHCPSGTRISGDDAACVGGAEKCASCDTGYTLQGDVCVPPATLETASATQLKDQFNSKYTCNDQ